MATVPKKLSLYARFLDGEGFEDVTAFAGSPIAGREILETCAIRFIGTQATFAYQRHRKADRTRYQTESLAIPEKHLGRSEARGAALAEQFREGRLILEYGKIEDWLQLTIEGGNLRLQTEYSGAELSVPKKPVIAWLHHRSEHTGIIVTVAHIGYAGRPGSRVGIAEAASGMLRPLCALASFRHLTGFDGVLDSLRS